MNFAKVLGVFMHPRVSAEGVSERPSCLAGGRMQAGFSRDGESVMQHVRAC